MKLKDRVQGMKLNTKFTSVIILFTTIPILLMTVVLFYMMRQNLVQEKLSQLEHTARQSEETVRMNMGAADMTTRLFLEDTELIRVLDEAAEGRSISQEELQKFRDIPLASLERMVYNNPLLYGVRVYDRSDCVQEIAPMLYQYSKMRELPWGTEEDPSGWFLDYRDTMEPEQENEQQSLIALVTPVLNRQNDRIGTVETMITMERMFPQMYRDSRYAWSCFYTTEGKMISEKSGKADSQELLEQLLSGSAVKDDVETYYEKSGGRSYVISCIPFPEMGGALVSVEDITGDIRRLNMLQNTFIAVMLLVFVVLAYLINRLVKRILQQFHMLLGTMHQVQTGDLSARTESFTGDETGELSVQFNRMLDRIQGLMKENIDRELMARNSEIRALQNQINAHFIYNVLESIKMMAEIDEEYVISDAITTLGKLLRYSMKWSAGNVQVREEVEYVQNYLSLMNLRFDYDIRLTVDLTEAVLEQAVPKMTLQPVVENAILHGMKETAEDIDIYIAGSIRDEECFIEITDTGRGMPEEKLEYLRKKLDGKTKEAECQERGIGLKNVQDRIRMAFGTSYGLEVVSQRGSYTKVIIRLPGVQEPKGHNREV